MNSCFPQSDTRSIARRITGASIFVLFLLLAFLNSFAAKADEQQITIMAFGDSLTQGYGLWPEDGFVPQLQLWLDDRNHKAKVLNFGVSGDTTSAGRARLVWSLSEDPDALILALGGNDVLRGQSPRQARENIAAMLGEITERDLPVLLVGIGAPANFGPDYQQAFADLYRDLSREYDALLYPNFLAPLTGTDDVANTLSKYFQNDGIHPNAEGVQLVVQEIGPYVEDLIARVTD